MAENKNAAHTLVCESQEVLYAKAVKKMKADRWIIQYAYKIENYLTAASMFEEVGNYLDAEELAAKCRELAEVTRGEQKESQYEKALELKKKAEKEKDYEKAAEAFEALEAYRDSCREKEDCEKRRKDCEKIRKRKEILAGMAVLLSVVLLVTGYFTGFYHYVMGVCYDSMGYYENAEEIFTGLGNLLDSQKRAQDCEKKVLYQQEAVERKGLKKAGAGSSVIFGSCKWKVLERRENQLLLILEQIETKGEFYRVPYQNTEEAAAWEESSLRNWLNGEILETYFDEEERAALLPADLSEKEYLTILTIDQVEEYRKILASLTGYDYWLRDSQPENGNAAFVSASGDIMSEGYSAQAQLSVRPVIRIDCGKLAEEEIKE